MIFATVVIKSIFGLMAYAGHRFTTRTGSW